MDWSEPLLALERLDLEADALRERRTGLPELAELEACGAALARLVEERAAAQERRAALEREERRLEADVADLASRAHEVEHTLYSGSVRAPRELEALQQEMQGFQRRQAEAEEAELAIMEQLEQIDAELAALGDRREALEAESARLRGAIAAARQEIDAELERLAAGRATVEPALPPSYREAYARVRAHARHQGRVTAPFVGGRCEGCRVALPIVEATRMRREPPEVVIQCPRCSRILLR